MKRRMHTRGVSLIEALVALAVMSFGMLGVVGMQATLRFNADVSKQRSEAVRLAQEEVERWRAFDSLTPAAGPLAYQQIVNSAATTVTLPGNANTSYTRSTTVITPAVGEPDVKSVSVLVQWLDRRTSAAAAAADSQSVSLSTQIAGIAPELAGSLALAGDVSALQRPMGRHPSIPAGATTPSGGNTSNFTPPGGSVSWTFNNATGTVTSVCTLSATPVCTLTNALLLSGYIQFATGAAPDLAEAANPVDTVPPYTIGMTVNVTAPSVATVSCFTASSGSTTVAYYCLVPTPGSWSGQSLVFGGTLPIAPLLANFDPTLFKVCRYTPVQGDSPPGGNIEHPLNYAGVNSSLANQNFLVISSGSGVVPYPCPNGAGVASNTWRHQPAT